MSKNLVERKPEEGFAISNQQKTSQGITGFGARSGGLMIVPVSFDLLIFNGFSLSYVEFGLP